MSFTVTQLLHWSQGRIINEADLEVCVEAIQVKRLVSLGLAQPFDCAFFFSKVFEHELLQANPSVLVIGNAFVQPLQAARLPFWKECVVISCSDPYSALACFSEHFAAVHSSVAHLPLSSDVLSKQATQVHVTAVLASSVHLGKGVTIGAFCVIEEEVWIEEGCVVYSGCTIGRDCRLGRNSVLFPNVTLYESTQIGQRVRIHAGSVIGADGFGYAPQRKGSQVCGHRKIYHLGNVVLGDDVEIGANTCVDRGTLGETRLEKNVKLDNLVHIGHNSRLEEGAILCGGTCLAGHVHIGPYAYIGGLTGIVNHVHVEAGGKVGAQSLITQDVPANTVAVGNPQRTYREHFRAHALLNQLLKERKIKK